ncbi:MAG: hypothetical protein P0107_05345 [Nitrosomonas sp.]|nr:hypothetical protein [Nitrosomonas sp.]
MVLDDLDMGITHVIRGVTITSTILPVRSTFPACAAQPSHSMPMILRDAERPETARCGIVMHYRDQAGLPEALINYLARLSWSHV